MSTPLKFLTGLENNLSSVDKVQGQVFFAVNEAGSLANIYYDYDNNTRININKNDGIGQEIAETYLKGVTFNNFSVVTTNGNNKEATQLIAFTGTQAEYETANAAGLIAEGMIVHITDDEDVAAEPTIAVTQLPAANANHRGRILLLEANETDTPYMCLKKSGVYAWYEIQTGTAGIPGED